MNSLIIVYNKNKKRSKETNFWISCMWEKQIAGICLREKKKTNRKTKQKKTKEREKERERERIHNLAL